VRRLLPGLVFFAITFAVAAVGALFTPGPWYEALAKPAWTPPGWVFAPVWTALYATIAVAGWVIWSARARIDLALILWGIQLALNGIWSWLFFGLENPAFAAVDIVLLLLDVDGLGPQGLPVGTEGVDAARRNRPVKCAR